MKKSLFWYSVKITVSALLIFSVLCTAFSVVAITNLKDDVPLSVHNAVEDIEQAQTNSTYSRACVDIKLQEDEAAAAYGYSYNSVSAVEDGIAAEKILTSETWHFGRQNLAQDGETGFYLPVGEVNDQGVWSGYYSSSEDVRSTVGANQMLYKWDSGEGEGLGVYNSKVFTFAGNKTNHASVLVFSAPQTGKIHLMPTTFAALSAGSPFWTLQDSARKTGVVIYKNGEKVWPTDSDYYTLTNTNRSVTTPDLSVEVTEGDKIYYKLIPLSDNWGYYTLDPVITYQRLGEPVAYSWVYREKDVTYDAGSAQYLPTGNWTQPELYHVLRFSDNEGTSDKHPNYLTKGERANVGIGVMTNESETQNDIITFINADKVSGITYTASKNGTVMVSDAIGGPIQGEHWGFSAGGDETYGIAVYRNEEKVWPADGFYTTEENIIFPVVPNIQVNAGDKITIALFAIVQNDSVYAFARFSPQVTYQTVGEQTDSVWSYSESATVAEDETGYQIASGEWEDIAVGRGVYPSSEEELRGEGYLKDMMYVHGANKGIGVYNNNVITFISNKAVALTYTAPTASDKVRLYDPNEGTITTPGTAAPFWMLDNGGETVGIAIYKNSEKIWPAEGNYIILNYENQTVAFPDLEFAVMVGDKIRVVIHPLDSCSWGYMYFGAPEIDYFENTYSSASAAVAYQETKDAGSEFADCFWSYEEKAIALDGEVYLPTGDWSAPTITMGGDCDPVTDIRSALPNMFYTGREGVASGRGLATYEGSVVTFIGSDSGYAPTLTYTAPLSGKVNISGNKLLGKMDSDTFLTVDEGDMVGFAIYQNSTRIWPETGTVGDFAVFSGESWDRSMPELNVEVTAGDKLRFMFVALKGVEWGYMSIDPQIQYTAVTGWGDAVVGFSIDESSFRKFYEIEEYDLIVHRLKADETSSVLPAEKYTIYDNIDDTIDGLRSLGVHSLTVEYVEKGLTYRRIYDAEVVETRYGDLDMNEAVEDLDLAYLRKHLLGLKPHVHIAVGNVNDDGKIDIIDLVRIEKHLEDPLVTLGPAD